VRRPTHGLIVAPLLILVACTSAPPGTTPPLTGGGPSGASAVARGSPSPSPLPTPRGPRSTFFREHEAESIPKAGQRYIDYHVVSDDSGSISVELPSEWADVNGRSWESEGERIGVGLSAAPDLEQFTSPSIWTVPGIFVGVASRPDAVGGINAYLGRETYDEECEKDERTELSDLPWTGRYDAWRSCGGTQTSFYVIAAKPKEGQDKLLLVVRAQVVSRADLAVIDRVFSTLRVSASLP
jgi:hypothetical protein